jgi:hypothetical protein
MRTGGVVWATQLKVGGRWSIMGVPRVQVTGSVAGSILSGLPHHTKHSDRGHPAACRHLVESGAGMNIESARAVWLKDGATRAKVGRLRCMACPEVVRVVASYAWMDRSPEKSPKKMRAPAGTSDISTCASCQYHGILQPKDVCTSRIVPSFTPDRLIRWLSLNGACDSTLGLDYVTLQEV